MVLSWRVRDSEDVDDPQQAVEFVVPSRNAHGPQSQTEGLSSITPSPDHECRQPVVDLPAPGASLPRPSAHGRCLRLPSKRTETQLLSQRFWVRLLRGEPRNSDPIAGKPY